MPIEFTGYPSNHLQAVEYPPTPPPPPPPPPDQNSRIPNLFKWLLHIQIKIGKKFCHTIEELANSSELREKFVHKVETKIAKNVDRVVRSAKFNLAEIRCHMNPEELLEFRAKVLNIKVLCIVASLLDNTAKIALPDTVDQIKDAKKLLKFFKKLFGYVDEGLPRDFDNFWQEPEACHEILKGFHGVLSLGTGFVDLLSSNELIKLTFVAAGLGRSFQLLPESIIEISDTIATPLYPIKVVLKVSSTFLAFRNWMELESNAPEAILHDRRIALIKSSLDMTVLFLKLVPMIVGVATPTLTIAVITIGSGTLSLYRYFGKKFPSEEVCCDQSDLFSDLSEFIPFPQTLTDRRPITEEIFEPKKIFVDYQDSARGG